MLKKMIVGILLSMPVFALPLISANGEKTSEDVFLTSTENPAEDSEEVYSDETAGSVIELEEIVISATRTEMDILNAPAHITVVSEDDFKKMGAKNISDIIAVHTGSSIRDYGPEGSQKTVSIRGSSQQGVLVLIDGVRMNDSRSGGIDLSLIPLHNIEKIEIMRGGTSALYGADAVGGLINIITKKEADNKLKIRFENGSYIPRKSIKVLEGDVEKTVNADPLDLVDTQKVSLQYSREAGPVDIVTSGSFIRANNAYVWNDTEYIDDYRKRVNADILGGDAFAGISIPFGSSMLEVNGLFSYSKKGAPGPLYWLSTDASQTDMLVNGNLHYKKEEFISDFLTFDIKANFKQSRLSYEDPDNSFPVDDRHSVRSFGVDMSQEVLYFNYFSIIYGLNFFFDSSDSTKIGKNERISGGFFIESPIYLAPRFTLTPVVRYDYYSDFSNSINFKLGGVFNISDSTSFKANIAKSYRAPTLNDLYWPYTPPFMGWSGEGGNPDLKPESAYSAEAGVTGIYDRVNYDVYTFVRYMTDEINWHLGSDDVWRPQNIGETLYPGIEAGGRINVFSNLWFTAGYTFLYSFVLSYQGVNYDFSDDKRMLYVPVHSADAGIEWRGIKNIASLYAQVESKRKTKIATEESIDGYIVLNAHYERYLTDNLTLLLTANNLLNSTYQTLNGYIMPPFFIMAGIEAVF
jgi:outer membrane cobalamin receptor